MAIKLLVRQGGGAASEPDYANLNVVITRQGSPLFEAHTPQLQMGQRWEQGTSAVGSFRFVDPTANSGYFFRPHATVKLIENDTGTDYTLSWSRIEGGWDTGRRAVNVGYEEIEHDVQVMDANLDLRGLPFEGGWSRPAETSWERLQALHAAKLAGTSSTAPIHRATTTITVDRFSNGHLVDATTPVDMDAKDYPEGTGVPEILDDIMGEWAMGWGVTLHHEDGVGTHRCLLVQAMDDLTKFTSDVRISDDLDDLDPDDPTAPTFSPIWRRSKGKLAQNEHVISGLISIYEGLDGALRTLTVETGEAPEDWEVWWDAYQDDQSHTVDPATRRANTILNDRKRPYFTNQPSILMNADQVHLITAGQSIDIKSVVVAQNADRHDWAARRIAAIMWEPEEDGRWWAHLDLDRPRNSRPARGGGPSGPVAPEPPTPGTVTTATGAGTVNNDSDQGATVPGGTGGLIAVLLTNAVATPSPTYKPTTAGTPEPMTIIGAITHPTPPSGGNKDGESLFVAYLANPTASGVGAGIEWGTAAGSQFGSLKGYWTTPSTETPTAFMNSGTGSTASATPTGAIAEDMVLNCAGWRIWSLGNASQTPIDLSSVTDDWTLAFNNSAGQNDGCWFGGHLAGPGAREVNVVTSTNWVAAAIILPGVGGDPGDETEPTGETGEGDPGSSNVYSPINHVHEHGLLSDDELHYHDVTQIEGIEHPLIETLSTDETDDTLVLAPDGVGGVEWVSPASSGTAAVTDHGSMGAAETFDFSVGSDHEGELDANLTVTLTGAVAGEAAWLTLKLTQDVGGGNTIDFPASVVNATDVETAFDLTASAVNVVTLFSYDGGTSWFAFLAGTGSSSVAALDDLTDVTITSPADADRLRYDGAEWVNSALKWSPTTTFDGTNWLMVVDGGGNPVLTEV